MSSRKMLLGSTGLVALLALGAGCGQSALASGQSTRPNSAAVWIEVRPATIEPGFTVSVRAECGDNTNTATVTSKAFRALTLEPHDSLLEGATTVPRTTRAGTYGVLLTCHTGAVATTTLSVVSGGTAPSSVGPHTGGGFLARATDLAGGQADASGPTDSRGLSLADPASLWLVGGAAALVLAAVIGATVRRRCSPRSARPCAPGRCTPSAAAGCAPPTDDRRHGRAEW
jgi:hypothetical protein